MSSRLKVSLTIITLLNLIFLGKINAAPLSLSCIYNSYSDKEIADESYELKIDFLIDESKEVAYMTYLPGEWKLGSSEIYNANQSAIGSSEITYYLGASRLQLIERLANGDMTLTYIKFDTMNPFLGTPSDSVHSRHIVGSRYMPDSNAEFPYEDLPLFRQYYGSCMRR